ncbi:MAG: 2Fe-2S iron-sulfur cluster-binding protein, partial [Pseudomonadota bacterium]
VREGRYDFASGLHYLGEETGPFSPRTLFGHLTGGAMQWASLPDEFDIYVWPDGEFRAPRRLEEQAERLSARFPQEAEAIARYFQRDLPSAARAMVGLHIANSAPPWLRAVASPLARLVCRAALRTTQETLDRRFRDAELKRILAFQWGDYGRAPSETAFGVHARIVVHYDGGAIYPIGGSRRIARKTIDLIERAGGEVRVGQEVRRILVEGGRAVGVEAVDRETGAAYRVSAKQVVSTAGAINTYAKLLAPEIGGPFAAELARLGPNVSAVILFAGFDRSPRDIGADGANSWVFAQADHEEAMRAPPGEGMLYFSWASLKNPAARAHSAEIVSLCEASHFRAWRDHPRPSDDPEYRAMKAAVAERIIARAEARFPGFRDALAFHELATPLTFGAYQNAVDGAFYGLPASPERLTHRLASPRTPIRGLFLAGQDAMSPGIVGAAAGGVRAVGLMLGVDRTGAVTRRIARSAAAPSAAPWNGFLRIRRIIDETPTVKSFHLETLDGAATPFAFAAGQYVNLHLPMPGRAAVRSYSISSAPAPGLLAASELRLTVKREAQGRGSRFLHDEMREGDLIEISGPHGALTLPADADGALTLIGGGVGVTPLMSVLEDVLARRPDVAPTAIFAFRDRSEIIFRERLDQLSRDERVRVHLVLSDEPDPAWTGRRGFLTAETLQACAPAIAASRIHVCGPMPMMEAVGAALRALGAPDDAVFTESFSAAAAPTAPTAPAARGAAFEAVFLRSGRRVQGRVGDTILDVAQQGGVDIDFSCGAGTCGACKLRVRAGRTETPRNDVLSQADRDAGYVLACQARPQGDVEIDA